MSSMIDAAARWLYERDGGFAVEWPGLSDTGKAPYLADARAVLQAMIEHGATEGALEAGLTAEFFLDAGGDAPAKGSETSLREILDDAGLSRPEQFNALHVAAKAYLTAALNEDQAHAE